MPAPSIRTARVPVLMARKPAGDDRSGDDGEQGSGDMDGSPQQPPISLGQVCIQATFFGSNCVWLFVMDAPEEGLPGLGAATVGIPSGAGGSSITVLKTPLLELQQHLSPAHAASLAATGNMDQVSATVSPQSTFATSLVHRLVKKYSIAASAGQPAQAMVVYAFCGVTNPTFVGTAQSGISPSAVAFSSAVMSACCSLIDEFRGGSSS